MIRRRRGVSIRITNPERRTPDKLSLDDLDDEVTSRDLATAMQRAWQRHKLPATRQSVDVVVHSTGALVARQWLTLFHAPDNNPVDRLLLLAPANYGSPLAHKGKGVLRADSSHDVGGQWPSAVIGVNGGDW